MTRKLRFIFTGFCVLLFFSLLGLGSVFARPTSHRSFTPPANEAAGRLARSQSAKPESSAAAPAVKQWETIGLSFTRTINVVEKAYHSRHGKYVTTMKLYHSGMLNGPVQGLVKQLGMGVVRNWHWTFYVDASPDGKGYQASVHGSNVNGRIKCLPVFFTDQSGTIYEGRATGCR